MSEAEARPEAETAGMALPVGVLCPSCGYDLRGSTSQRCSECGFGLDPLRTRETLIPWSHRRELGWFRAYWKTVWQVLRRPREFCVEIARPVSYRDSQSFRWLTTAAAYLPILVGSGVGAVLESWDGSPITATDWWVLGGLNVWAGSALVLLPGLASCFFHPRHLSIEYQNRAIALSYYAWAPLALTPLAVPFWLATMLLWQPWGSTYQDLAGVLGGLIQPVALGLAYWRLQRFARYTLHGGIGGRFQRLILLGLASGAVLLLLLLVPLSFFYIAVIIYSLV